jgi:hypothetical protein
MIIKADASQLEWRVKVLLAQDTVGIREIQEGYPIHEDNQKVFGLPTRTIAKIFLYRAIFADAFGEQGFAGPAFAYANDSDFMQTSTSPKFWENVMARFFEKYSGVYEHSIGLIRRAIETGKIESPSGRFYLYSPVSKWNGTKDWPRTQILNHIVQGFSADLIMLARLLVRHRLPKLNYGQLALPINTVHDDIQFDVANDPEMCYNISIMLEKAFADIPMLFKAHYGKELNVPMAGEVKIGWSLFEPEMMKFNPATFNEDWKKLYA